MTTTNYQYQGVDLGSILGAKGTHTAATTNFRSASNDLCNILLDIVDGTALGYTLPYEASGTSFTSIFAAPSTALPINGQAFNGTAHLAGSTYSCELTFGSTTTTWSVTSNGGAVTPATGSVPSGAATVQYAITATSGSPSLTNGAASATTLTGTAVTCISSVSGSTQGISGQAQVVITYRNSAGSVISTTTIYFTTTT